MRILQITRVVPQQGFSVFHGVVTTEVIRTGDDIALVDAAGKRDAGLISSIAVEDATEGSIGARLLDEGKRGQSVRVTVRCRKPSIEASDVVAFETP